MSEEETCVLSQDGEPRPNVEVTFMCRRGHNPFMSNFCVSSQDQFGTAMYWQTLFFGPSAISSFGARVEA